MPETLAPVAPQPAPTAQTSGESKATGKANATVQQFAQRFLQKDAAPAPAPEAKDAPKTEGQAAATPLANAEEAAPATEADQTAPAAETDAEANDALSQSNSQVQFTPEQQEIFDKRLGKEIAKRKEAEKAANDAAARLNELMLKATEPAAPTQEAAVQPQIVPLPNGTVPLANIPDVNGLLSLQAQAKEAIRWSEQQLEREDFDQAPPINPQTNAPYTRAELKSIKWNAKTTLEDHIPQRAQFLQQRNQIQQDAYTKFPFLKDKAAPEYLIAEQLRRSSPWLANLPAQDLLIGAYIRGMQVVEAETAAKATKTAKTAPKPRPAGDGQSSVSTGATSDRVPISTINRAAMQDIDAKLTKKGGVTAKDYAAALAQKSNIRNSR